MNAGLLADIKAVIIIDEKIVINCKQLEKEEDLVYSGIAPATSNKVVKATEVSMKTKRTQLLLTMR